MTRKEYYTTTEVAEELGSVSPSTVYRWAVKGHIKASRPAEGCEFRIPRSEVERLKGEVAEVTAP